MLDMIKDIHDRAIESLFFLHWLWVSLLGMLTKQKVHLVSG